VDINKNLDSPFHIKISFNKFLNQYDDLIQADNDFIASNARRVLKIAEEYPVLRTGFSDLSLLKSYEKEIEGILQDAFNPILSGNEIKAASVPFHDILFNISERFKTIIETAGEGFDLKIKNMPSDDVYIIACTIIMKICYGFDVNFKRPFLYEIPDEKGIMRYYKILYNADFVEISPNEKAHIITQADVDELLDNFKNIKLWKDKFPPGSHDFKGFVISNMFDITDDQSISNIKSTLIKQEKRKDESFMKDFQEVFRSLLGIKDINVGFAVYNADEDTLDSVYGLGLNSYLLNDQTSVLCSEILCKWSYKKLLEENEYFSVSDVDKVYAESIGEVAPHIASLKSQDIKSVIFAPIANEEGLLGILEIVSDQPKKLNSINANKLLDIMPFIVSAVERSKKEEENLIEAIIQKECTSIHPSVHWKFTKEAREYIKTQVTTKSTPTFKKIGFENVYPLYGQIDVRSSSNARNNAVQKDLSLQLSLVQKIFEKTLEEKSLPIYEQFTFQLAQYHSVLESNFKVDSEREITNFLKDDVAPFLKLIKKNHQELKPDINEYFDKIDSDLGVIYYYRKHYDDTVRLINRSMSKHLDHRQEEAQKMYPHFFERYKTDGVEHNMYIGNSITKENTFNSIYLYNLRLWQMQVMCEMENKYYSNQHQFPLALDVASMILVFNQPLSIRFRMEEKRFDVDGTYNARYEVIKKRVDKACIKGTEERITQKGKLTIVYSQKEDKEEYLRYIKFLQSKKFLDEHVELLELEDLQGMTGLKALRVGILYHNVKDNKEYYTYDDLMETITS